MSEDSQEQSLDAVAEVIVRDGVRGASMRTVAQEAGVSLGLLSYHFTDKSSLITAAYARAADRLLLLGGFGLPSTLLLLPGCRWIGVGNLSVFCSIDCTACRSK